MMWHEHLIITWACFKNVGIWDVLYSIAPDIPMVLFLSMMKCSWKEMKNTWPYFFLYEIPHSACFCLLIDNKRHRKIYLLHILLDILTHVDEFAMRPFLPLEFRVNGIWDPVVWN